MELKHYVRRQELCRGVNCIFCPRLRSSAQEANILFHAFHYRLRLCAKNCHFKKEYVLTSSAVFTEKFSKKIQIRKCKEAK